VDRPQYRIGTTESGYWEIIASSDDKKYWGEGREVVKKVSIEKQSWEEKPHSMEFSLPGLTVLFYKFFGEKDMFRPAKTQPGAKAQQKAEVKDKAVIQAAKARHGAPAKQPAKVKNAAKKNTAKKKER
jgi:hypothetical protein